MKNFWLTLSMSFERFLLAMSLASLDSTLKQGVKVNGDGVGFDCLKPVVGFENKSITSYYPVKFFF